MNFSDKALQNPYFIFLIDGVGAGVTSLSLLLVLPNLPEVFNMPVNILYFLGLIALVFAAYSFGNFFAKWSTIKLLIRIIAIANLMYCLLSGFIVAQLFSSISTLDVLYFAGEILIVSVLAVFELRLAKRIEPIQN